MTPILKLLVLSSRRELVTNGTFDTDTTGWTAGGSGSIEAVGGQLVVTQGAPASYGQATQSVPTVEGRVYEFRWTIAGGTAAAAVVQIQGSSVGLPDNGTYSHEFTATGSSAAIVLAVDASASVGQTKIFDNISVRRAR